MSSSAPTQREDQLSPSDRQRLKGAYRALREAVAAYESFTNTGLKPGQPVPVQPFAEMREAQAAVGAAQREVWRLREELLGWVPPSWVVSDDPSWVPNGYAASVAAVERQRNDPDFMAMIREKSTAHRSA